MSLVHMGVPAVQRSVAGFSMIEVLVTIAILAIGLLGMAGLQAKALTTQMESYQREQALILVRDMVDRINSNRKNAASYAVASLGGPNACPAMITDPSDPAYIAPTDPAYIAPDDLATWCNQLKGAAEKAGASGPSVGAMVGATGCITQVNPGAVNVPAEYLVAVAWQGLNSTSAPIVTCGSGNFGADDGLRRVIALPVRIAYLL